MDFLPPLQAKRTVSIYANIAFVILSILVCVIRVKTLISFSFIYTDSDQAVLWNALYDMKRGIFHEPCFYGQNHSLLVEPFFALPLAWAGVPTNIALPIITSLLAMLPFFLLGLGCLRRGHYLSACLALVIPLWLPVEYDAMSSIPRGFVGATAIASMGVYFALFSNNRNNYFWFALFSVIGFATNADAVFLAFPVALVSWLKNVKNSHYYKGILLGALAAAIVPGFKFVFYKIHPEYNFHRIDFSYTPVLIKTGIQESGKIFKMLSPYNHHKLAAYFIINLLFSAICFLRREWQKGVSIILTLILVLTTLSFYQAHEGNYSIFYSPSRMYLGLPVLLVIFGFWAEEALGRAKWQILAITLFLFIGIMFFSQRYASFSTKMTENLKLDTKVEVHTVEYVYLECKHLSALADRYHARLIITYERCVNYICPTIYPSLKTLEPDYERRTWGLKEEDTTHLERFIYYDCDSAFVKNAMAKGYTIKVVALAPMSCFIENKGENTLDIVRKLGIPVRPFK